MCLWRQLISRHYPKAVLPHISYKQRIDINELVDTVQGLLVSRRIDGRFDEYTENRDGLFFLTLNALGNILQLPQMSLDLLGALYSPSRHQRFRVTGNGRLVWDGKTVYRLAPKTMFQFWDNSCCSVAIEAKKLHRIPLPYKKTLSLQQHQELVDKGIDIEKFCSKKEYDLHGEILLDHLPTMLNYWHVQANSIAAGESAPMRGETKGWRGIALRFLVQYLLTLPVKDASMCRAPVVSKDYYLNK